MWWQFSNAVETVSGFWPQVKDPWLGVLSSRLGCSPRLCLPRGKGPGDAVSGDDYIVQPCRRLYLFGFVLNIENEHLCNLPDRVSSGVVLTVTAC